MDTFGHSNETSRQCVHLGKRTTFYLPKPELEQNMPGCTDTLYSKYEQFHWLFHACEFFLQIMLFQNIRVKVAF